MTKPEVYISIDVEASGPTPPAYSMLSLGACVVDAPETRFYAELKPLDTRTDSAAMQVVGRPLRDFEANGKEPADVMIEFHNWVRIVSSRGTPIFVGFNAVFDWAFVNWYLLHFTGTNPFGPGGIDIKSYYMGQLGVDWSSARASQIPEGLKGHAPVTHNALDDAVRQATLFRNLLSRRDRLRLNDT